MLPTDGAEPVEGAEPGGEPIRQVRPPVRKPSPPSSRPTWLVVLSSVMLIYGGLLLVASLNTLRDPLAAARIPTSQTLPPERVALNKQLAEVGTQILTGHLRSIRIRAVASLLVAAAMLYAAAAALSRDRHGRTVTLGAAWLGIVYQLGTLPLVIPLARDNAVTAPLLAQAIVAEATATAPPPAASGSDAKPLPTPETIAGVMRSMFIVVPVVTALMGIGVSVLLLVYYGGRRGRTLYGLMPPRQ